MMARMRMGKRMNKVAGGGWRGGGMQVRVMREREREKEEGFIASHAMFFCNTYCRSVFL
jgi:hypothetical protein